ncbi:MAG TPA: GNAT family N-acetyltransferase [Steroidobacteraceae bacterium]|nr:GNAT family N-acetyltransferase [Steroidobacteraceae bacterium]
MAIDFEPRPARTRDGAAFTIRAIQPTDFALEDHFIRSLSEESRYLRLMYTLKEPPVSFVERLVNVDGEQTMALAAVIESAGKARFIAVSRYGLNPDGHGAEFAIAVTDAWQRRGVATQLMQALADYAKRHGVERFEGEVLRSNERMLDLCRWLKFEMRPSPQGRHLVIASRRL